MTRSVVRVHIAPPLQYELSSLIWLLWLPVEYHRQQRTASGYANTSWANAAAGTSRRDLHLAGKIRTMLSHESRKTARNARCYSDGDLRLIYRFYGCLVIAMLKFHVFII